MIINELKESVKAYHKEQYNEAVERLLHLFQNDIFDSRANVNLSYIISHHSLNLTYETIYNSLKKYKDYLSIHKTLLNAQIIYKENYELDFKHYINKIKFHTKNDRENTVFYWHIPKCSGTYITHLLSSYFYNKSYNELFMDYSHKALLTKIINQTDVNLPFISSTHIPMHELNLQKKMFQFAILRDPIDKTLSMYRQIKSSLGHQKALIPAYGFSFDYNRVDKYIDFLELIPKELLFSQLSTFSKSLNVEAASTILKNLDYVIMRDKNLGSEEQLLKKLNINLSSLKSTQKDINSSDKSIIVQDEEKKFAHQLLESEYALIQNIKP